MSKTKTELPPAIYAVAGAGELAYQQLRKLPEATARTLRTAGETADALRERLSNGRRRDLTGDLTAELNQVRESARRSASAFAARAAEAQEKAVTRYRDLVAHGEQVVNDRFGLATGETEPPAKIEIVVGDVDEEPAGAARPAAARPGTPGSTAAGPTKPAPGGTATKPAPGGTTTKPASAAGASRSATGPNARGVAKTGTRAGTKRASS